MSSNKQIGSDNGHTVMTKTFINKKAMLGFLSDKNYVKQFQCYENENGNWVLSFIFNEDTSEYNDDDNG